MRTIIAGGRDFNDYELLKKHMDAIHAFCYISEVVSGTARGADTLGEQWATEKNIPIKRFPADWEYHGKSAGYRRNEEMAKYAGRCVLFWDGKSKGTQHMRDIATRYKLSLKIINYGEHND